MSVKTSAKQFAKFARIENKLSEKFSLKYPRYQVWGDSCFNESKDELITILGKSL